MPRYCVIRSSKVINVINLDNSADYQTSDTLVQSNLCNIGDTWNGGNNFTPAVPVVVPSVSYIGGKSYAISATEPNPKTDYWDEPDSNGRITQWAWNGSNWLSREIFREQLALWSGQTISLLGAVVGSMNNNSADLSFSTGNVASLFLVRLNVGFTIAGNLTASNYWRLNFKSGGSVVQSLNIQSGNNNETTGDIRKSGTEINQIYAHNGRYQLNIQKIGNAPDISNPTAMIEYRLVRA